MKKRLILPESQFDIAISRLCHQLIENFPNFDDTVFLGLQPRGIFLAQRIQSELKELGYKDVPVGQLDTTFHRDDFRRKDNPISANKTSVPFLVEDKKVILIDDVLYTGRSVRAALDAMIAFGRARSVHLLVLVSRKNAQELPIKASFIGKLVNTMESEKVIVEWSGKSEEKGKVWLVGNSKDNG